MHSIISEIRCAEFKQKLTWQPEGQQYRMRFACCLQQRSPSFQGCLFHEGKDPKTYPDKTWNLEVHRILTILPTCSWNAALAALRIEISRSSKATFANFCARAAACGFNEEGFGTRASVQSTYAAESRTLMPTEFAPRRTSKYIAFVGIHMSKNTDHSKKQADLRHPLQQLVQADTSDQASANELGARQCCSMPRLLCGGGKTLHDAVVL